MSRSAFWLLWGRVVFCGFSEFDGFGEFDVVGWFLWGLVSLWGWVVFMEQGGFYGVGVRRVVGNGRIFQPEPATQ